VCHIQGKHAPRNLSQFVEGRRWCP
jgi:hypothetical protein